MCVMIFRDFVKVALIMLVFIKPLDYFVKAYEDEIKLNVFL